MRYRQTAVRTALCLLLGVALFTGCGDSSQPAALNPSEGLITTVREVQPNDWRIADEQIVADTNDSRIIAEHISGRIDTFTLAEARAAQSLSEPTDTTSGNSSNGYHGRHYYGGGYPFFSIASWGLMGYYMGRSMGGGFSPRASAYVDPQTYNRVTSTAGTRLRSTAVRRSAPTGGRSGFGSGRSTRSFGG